MSTHWLFFMAFGWGHLRPESVLAMTLARRYPNVTISCIVDSGFVDKGIGEMQRNAKLEHDDSPLSRIRVIGLGKAMENFDLADALKALKDDPRNHPAIKPAVVEAMLSGVDAIMEQREFVDDAGTTWKPIAKPTFIISDMMFGRVTPRIKRKYPEVPMYMWYGGCATSFTRYYAPNEYGGRAPGYVDECHAIEADPERSQGKPFIQISHEVWATWPRTKDNIINVKGLPPFYVWEDSPQMTWIPAFYDSVEWGLDLVSSTDGLMLPTVLDIEAEGVEGVLEWYKGEANRPVLCLGPQLPSDYFAPVDSKRPNALAGTEVRFGYKYKSPGSAGEEGEEVDPCIALLDDALEKYGPHSAIYISFGTTFYPQPEHVILFLERLLALEKPMPFIFSASSPFARVPEGLKEKIKLSGRGMVVPWAPQQAILGHSALGYIVSHCGGGGTYESLTQGVPVIGWPFTCDQPHHALWMSEVLDTGFELLQVRDGPIKGKAYRGGPQGTEIEGTMEAAAREMDDVLLKCQGEEGRRKRENTDRVKEMIWEARKKGGSIDREFGRFVQFAGGVEA